ncbi:class I SAM-dependent methyltransferase [Flavobacterium sp. LB3R33]|uniref:class I SAM-dependent methyltransferase n=1 Tax=Flavobacterium sp. LB3R33 TaxID=3401721 RepID=UPI003AAEE6A5
MTPINYKDNFHSVHFENSLNSAKEVVPKFMTYFKPESVLDVGCGLGTWLKIFEELGCDIFGIDGDYINTNDLVIDSEKFKDYDLNLKFDLQKKFDLVISLEVAEHIYSKNAKTYVDSICLHGDVVLFSAAIPGQEGTLHYNEQYNDYWVNLFSVNGYQCIDFLRHEIWNNEKISWWYRQNILIFIKVTEIDNPKFKLLQTAKTNNLNSYVHPKLLEYKCWKAKKMEQILNNPLAIIKYYLNNRKIG